MLQRRIRICLLLLSLLNLWTTHAAKVVVIGDSLSAEYEAIPDFPGTENPTEYARITVNGWEAMSWVEVLARLRGEFFDFGRFKADLTGWLDLRFSGYEFNFAIPGFRAAQYEEIVNSSLFSQPLYIPFRLTLQDALKGADRAVIWLGGNEFRANYSFLANGGDPAALIRNLTDDLEQVIAFAQRQRSNLHIVIGNIPDLGAAPDKRAAQPDPARRALVTAATRQANEAIANLAALKRVAVADVFPQTERLINGEITFFGAVNIINDPHPDNHPRYHFTREGLHPNTPSQIQIARVMIEAFNSAYDARIPPITDAEALELLGLDPHLPYFDWIDGFPVAQKQMEDDPDGDGLANIVELALGLDPAVPSRLAMTLSVASERLTIAFPFDSSYRRLVKFVPQHSTDLANWTDLPGAAITIARDGRIIVSMPAEQAAGFLRLKVAVISPE